MNRARPGARVNVCRAVQSTVDRCLIRSLHTGIPGQLSFAQQQDDLLMKTTENVGGYIPLSWTPSIVTRVYLPPWEYWENRTGSLSMK